MAEKNEYNFISRALLEQFKSKWDMLRQSIEKYPNDHWGKEEGEWTYAWIIYHIIETAKFYVADSPEKMKWSKRVGIDWDKDNIEEIIKKKSRITKEFLLEYLEEIEQDTNKLLESLTLEDYDKNDGFHQFQSVFEKLVYLLRHSTLHLGELSKELRNKEYDRMKWT